MSALIAAAPPVASYQSFHRFTVDEYHRMIEVGILDDEDKIELLEGYLVVKMPRNPPHDGPVRLVGKRLDRLVPAGWDVRTQSAITLAESEPEPDVVIARGDERTYLTRHPTPADIALVVEVADSSLQRDSADKTRIYARAGIPIYWIVNLVDVRIEVYTDPSGPTQAPDYATRQDYVPGDDVPLSLDGVTVARVPAADLLP